MTHHGGDALGDLVAAELLGAVLLGAGWAYVAAARRVAWPRGRAVRWVLGIAAAVAGVAVGARAHDPAAHVAGHLLVGMLAPLLLVTAAPVTLALRRLPHPRARALARALHARPVAVVSHPAVAAVLDTGGMWLLFRTDLLAAVPPALVHGHMLLAGALFASALVGSDPAPHRAPLAVRAAVLVVAVAAHDVLAKLVYADGAQTAGLLLYYGAAPVHLALFVLLGREWLARQQRARVRRLAAA